MTQSFLVFISSFFSPVFPHTTPDESNLTVNIVIFNKCYICSFKSINKNITVYFLKHIGSAYILKNLYYSCFFLNFSHRILTNVIFFYVEGLFFHPI